MAKKLYEESNIQAIADAIRAKNGTEDTYKTSEMAAAIEAIESGGAELPEEAFIVKGNCMYRFSQNGWNWYIDTFGDKVTTTDVSDMSNMFASSNELTTVPFEINCQQNTNTTIAMNFMFSGCTYLTEIPKINNCKPGNMQGIFSGCHRLKALPEDIESWFDWSSMDGATSPYTGNRSSTFNSCYSLRSVPMGFLNHSNPVASYSYSIYYSLFNDCYALDEIVGLPVSITGTTLVTNVFGGTFNNCTRVKNITFALQDDGTPYTIRWKNQVIDLSGAIGHLSGNPTPRILSYNSGITEDKYVKDDETYQALKNDPDWYTISHQYCRYNHDSAVATINSLPDTSAYLAETGGTNTIKFKGASGELTDGGAINTLTEEEIAVAAARGWTVTLV